MKTLNTQQKKLNSIKIWNNISSNEKIAFGEKFITHETNLNAWNKLFNDLSELKKQRVINGIELFSKNYIIL